MNDVVSAEPVVLRRRGAESRIEHQPAFVLHTYPWRETSLIVEALTRDYGRMAMVARGAKRRTSQLRGLLSPFSGLALGWTGRGEVKTLVRAEWTGGLVPLRGDSLLAGFYLNELVVRLLARADSHPRLFGTYARTLHALASDDERLSATLRAFEFELLREIGYLPALDVCADGDAVEPEASYRIDPQQGLVRSERNSGTFSGDGRAARSFADSLGELPPQGGGSGALNIAGSTALAMAAGDFITPKVAAEAKQMLRLIIRYHLEGRPLNTRRILQDLKEL